MVVGPRNHGRRCLGGRQVAPQKKAPGEVPVICFCNFVNWPALTAPQKTMLTTVIGHVLTGGDSPTQNIAFVLMPLVSGSSGVSKAPLWKADTQGRAS